MSGTAGTGKTSLVAHFVDTACSRGERCLYFAFEESPAQIVRNMQSIGPDMQPRLEGGLLRLEAARPSLLSLWGDSGDVYAMLLRTVDLLKSLPV